MYTFKGYLSTPRVTNLNLIFFNFFYFAHSWNTDKWFIHKSWKVWSRHFHLPFSACPSLNFKVTLNPNFRLSNFSSDWSLTFLKKWINTLTLAKTQRFEGKLKVSLVCFWDKVLPWIPVQEDFESPWLHYLLLLTGIVNGHHPWLELICQALFSCCFKIENDSVFALYSCFILMLSNWCLTTAVGGLVWQ